MSTADLAAYDRAELEAELHRVESALAGLKGRRRLTAAETAHYKAMYSGWLRDRAESVRAELQARGAS